MEKALFLRFFFKVSIDHLFDNLESGKINYCFGKSLEKVLNFGSKICTNPEKKEIRRPVFTSFVNVSRLQGLSR